MRSSPAGSKRGLRGVCDSTVGLASEAADNGSSGAPVVMGFCG